MSDDPVSFDETLKTFSPLVEKLARMGEFNPSPVLGIEDTRAEARAVLFEARSRYPDLAQGELEKIFAAWFRNRVGKLKLREKHRGEHAKLSLSGPVSPAGRHRGSGEGGLPPREARACSSSQDAHLEQIFFQEYVRVLMDMLPVTARQVLRLLVSPTQEMLDLRAADFEHRAATGADKCRLRRVPVKAAYARTVLDMSPRGFSTAMKQIREAVTQIIPEARKFRSR